MQPIAHRRIWLLLWSSTHPSNLTLDHLYCCVTRWNNSFILNIYRRLGKSATIYIGGECSIRLKTFVYWKIENCDWNHCCTQLFLSNHRCLNIRQWIQECIDVKNVWPLLCTLLPGGLWIKSMTCSNYSYVPSLGLVPTDLTRGAYPTFTSIFHKASRFILVWMWNHAIFRSWYQPVLSNECNVLCSMKQQESLYRRFTPISLCIWKQIWVIYPTLTRSFGFYYDVCLMINVCFHFMLI